MNDIGKIMFALECCSKPGSFYCRGCPYKDMENTDHGCNEALCTDALHVIQAKYDEREKQTSVCFEGKTLDVPCVEAGEGSAAAYWRGYADALKWAFDGRFEGMDGAEVQDNA